MRRTISIFIKLLIPALLLPVLWIACEEEAPLPPKGQGNYVEGEAPSVQLNGVTNQTDVTFNSIKLSITLTQTGNRKIERLALVYSTNLLVEPTIGNATIHEMGEYDANQSGKTITADLTNLNHNSTYRVRVYAKNNKGEVYSSARSYTTKLDTRLPQVTTGSTTGITQTAVTLYGNITSAGSGVSQVSQHGHVWATHTLPTLNDSKTQNGALGVSNFISAVAGLQQGTMYYYRAYATNATGTSYGETMSFSTQGTPTLTTNDITQISYTTAFSGGSLTSNGGATVSQVGVVWSTSPNPTIEQNQGKTITYSNTTFTASLNNLTNGTTYYVRAYATNSHGTGYGDQKSFKTTMGTLATLTTAQPTNVEYVTATSGGTVSADGGRTVSQRGLVWDTIAAPTILRKSGTVTSGSGLGTFTGNMSTLLNGKKYYVRAYALTEIGYAYGNEHNFTTKAYTPATITTTAISEITTTSARSGGNVTADGGTTVTARGVVWSTTQNPTIALSTKTNNGSGTGTFTSNLTGLAAKTTYYVRAYATNSAGTTYGSEISFTTTDMSIPVLTTTAASNITQTSSSSGGNITSDGGSSVTARGVVWSTSQNPTVSLSTKTSNGTGTGAFTSSITGLTANTTYYVRAYATNNTGTAYGAQVSFTTTALAVPTITTTAASNITQTTATSGGVVTFDGGANVTARGVVWSTTQNPTVSLSTKTSNGTGTGAFTSSITGLTANTTYYVRAYATNSSGTAYGAQVSFTTTALAVPILTTTAASNITQTSANSGGNIASDGGSSVTSRGVVWSTSQNPTISLSTKSSNGMGIGTFTSNITGLNANTTYYVRSYATNSLGTNYGSELTFTTIVYSAPSVTTTPVSKISYSTVTSGGNVTSDGGASVTAKGVVWSTNPNPTISLNTKTNDGTGIGSFTSNITGLTDNTTYHIRTYATNSYGTNYGTEISFTTLLSPCRGVTPPSGYGIVASSGKCWLDRNLGASRVATSSTDTQAYGDLYQWGRGTDGHEKRASQTTSTLSSSDSPGHGKFISGSTDSRSPQNNNLWQGVNGINNPCPSGFRIPTAAEWEAERSSWSSSSSLGAYASPLKLPVAGSRDGDGSLFNVGSSGYYWSGTVNGTGAQGLDFSSGDASMYSFDGRARGFSVRCLKDN